METYGVDHPPATDSFLPLKENRLAAVAVERLRNRRFVAMNSLVYLYGHSGVGKSHLVQQFLRDARRTDRSLRVAHLTAGEFSAQLAEASANQSTDQFQQRFRHLDILACEDLGALENRLETQRQLIAVLDEILAAGGCVLLTCRKLPGELTHVLPRLVSRCHGGACVALQSPGRASRISLISHFAGRRQIPLSPAAAAMLADALPVSPRELLATVMQLDTCARLEKSPLDPEFVRRYLDGEVKPRSVTLPQIARTVARHFSVKAADLRSSTRPHGLVLPRHCAMFLARELTGESLAAIAAFFGRHNHSTVVHACNRLKKILSDEPALRQHLTQIRGALGVTEKYKT